MLPNSSNFPPRWVGLATLEPQRRRHFINHSQQRHLAPAWAAAEHARTSTEQMRGLALWWSCLHRAAAVAWLIWGKRRVQCLPLVQWRPASLQYRTFFMCLLDSMGIEMGSPCSP